MTLVLRKSKDTRDIVVFSRLLLFGEIANDVTSTVIPMSL